MKETHTHHIIPKHLGGTDDPSNLIELTIEEHAEAHRILYEEHNNKFDYIAWKTLTGQLTFSEASKLAIIEGASRGGKKGGRIGGRKTAEGWKNGTIEFPGLKQPKEVRANNMRKNRLKCDLSAAGKNGSKNTNSQKWKCLECSMITNSGSLTHHQRKYNHVGRERI